MTFETCVKVRFADVDPAGIVFYPRYFEMLNGAVEDWFAQSLGLDFRTMHLERHIGVPTVKLDVAFLSPSELGDELTIRISPCDIGRSSCTISVLFTGAGRDRLRADVVLVCMDLSAQRSTPWPESVRARMEAQLAPAN
jgi:4-hydroxybenzoyl-CoA thioesterase